MQLAAEASVLMIQRYEAGQAKCSREDVRQRALRQLLLNLLEVLLEPIWRTTVAVKAFVIQMPRTALVEVPCEQPGSCVLH